MRAARLAPASGPRSRPSTPARPSSRRSRPYHYAPTRRRTRCARPTRARVVILGSGPNRIGQGIEFDYCCVHASMALRDAGYETVMVNCNPETVSTDYDTSDRLYFEPLTAEDVANVLDAELGPAAGVVVGVIVSLGGQTPLKLAGSLPPELVLGTSPASIDLAEDRERWNALCDELGIPQPPGGTASTTRPRRSPSPAGSATRCCCGRATCSAAGPWRSSTTTTGVRRVMQSTHDGRAGPRGRRHRRAARCWSTASWRTPSRSTSTPCATPTGEVLIGGVMEHVEEAGVHSGDSACACRRRRSPTTSLDALERHTRALAEALEVCGPAQRPVRREGRAGLRARGQPAGQPHRALRGQGDGRARWPWWRRG